MDPQLDNQLRLTRRQFFGLASAGIGTAALATLMGDDLRAAGTPGALQGLPHFAPTAKRVIYLFQSGGPAQMDLFDYKPRLHDLRGTELPASVRMGQRLTGMTSAQATFPVAPPNFKFAQHGQSGAWVSELMPHTAKVVDDSVLRQVDAHRGDQSRSGHHVLPDRLPAGRPAEHRRLGFLRTGQREQRPAGVRRHDLAGHRTARRPAALRPAVGQRISAEQVSGREVPIDGRSGAVPLEPGGLQQRRAPAIPRRSGEAEPDEAGRVWRSGDRDAHRAVRDGVPDADVGARADRSLEGARSHLRDVRSRVANARHVCRQLPARAAAGRARRPLHSALSPRLGSAQHSARS